MPTSLNASFTGAAAADPEFDHPAGASLVRAVQHDVQRQGWVTEEFDNWRDAGWSFMCSRGSARLEVVLSSTGSDNWLMQVAPATVPGLVGRAFGGKPSATPSDVFDSSKAIHRSMAEGTSYRGFRWQWDGPPTETADGEPSPSA
jgi:hypothetical protein